MIKGYGRPEILSVRVVVKVHHSGPREGKPKLWYWACSLCGLTYMVKRCASCCCFEKKDRHWLKHLPYLKPIGRLVDGKFERFKKGDRPQRSTRELISIPPPGGKMFGL